MAKRRAHDALLHDSPPKRCYRALHGVDVQLQSALPTEGVSRSPPSLLALLGRRRRKRPHFFENTDKDEETAAPAGSVHHKTAECDTRKHVANVLKLQTPGGPEARCSSGALTSHKKRQRKGLVCPNTVATKANEETDADTNTEDTEVFNSFQYWRVPLPELDLSLLEDACDHSQAKYKDSCCEAMET